MTYSTKSIGSKYSTSFKTYITYNDKPVSAFHDIPLFNGEYVNCVNEIPRFEHAKFEISKSEKMNPIVQDTKKGKVRFVKNIYPCYGYQFNYGALPQTWEDPEVKDSFANANGDNDPLDILDIGSKRKNIGEVYQAKVLGALGLLDDGESDWKIFVIDVNDSMADRINNMEDVEREFPNLIKNAVTWFRDYKVPDNKPKNAFVFDGEVKDANFAKNIINECHQSWKKLISSGYEGISLVNSTLESAEEFNIEGAAEADSSLPDGLYEFSFVK